YPEVHDTVSSRHQSSEDARVGCVGNRTRRERLREADAISRESIKTRSLNSIVAVTVNMVRPQSINSDEVNVRWRSFGYHVSSGRKTCRNQIQDCHHTATPHMRFRLTLQQCRRSNLRTTHVPSRSIRGWLLRIGRVTRMMSNRSVDCLGETSKRSPPLR